MADVPTPSRVASSTTSVEEITLLKKKPQVDKRKERASSQPSCVWDNTDLAQTKAQEVFSIDELKALFGGATQQDGGLSCPQAHSSNMFI